MSQAEGEMQRLGGGSVGWPWRLPPSLWAALAPWWLSLWVATAVLLEGRLGAGVAWLAGGLAWSALVGTVALLRLAADPA